MFVHMFYASILQSVDEHCRTKLECTVFLHMFYASILQSVDE
jgi:hypothetical protein